MRSRLKLRTPGAPPSRPNITRNPLQRARVCATWNLEKKNRLHQIAWQLNSLESCGLRRFSVVRKKIMVESQTSRACRFTLGANLRSPVSSRSKESLNIIEQCARNKFHCFGMFWCRSVPDLFRWRPTSKTSFWENVLDAFCLKVHKTRSIRSVQSVLHWDKQMNKTSSSHLSVTGMELQRRRTASRILRIWTAEWLNHVSWGRTNRERQLQKIGEHMRTLAYGIRMISIWPQNWGSHAGSVKFCRSFFAISAPEWRQESCNQINSKIINIWLHVRTWGRDVCSTNFDVQVPTPGCTEFGMKSGAMALQQAQNNGPVGPWHKMKQERPCGPCQIYRFLKPTFGG